MERVLIGGLVEKVGEKAGVAGWVQTVRKHGKIAFFDLRDRSGVLQITAFDPDVVAVVANLGQQDVVSVEGAVKKREEKYVNPDSPTGSIELEAAKITILSKAATVPFDMGGKTLDLQLPTLLDNRALTLRHQSVAPIFTVQAAILEGFRKVATELECTEIVVPTIAAGATEGGAEVFQIDYFGHKAFLTQSPQLYKQMMIPVFERVYTIAHAYRAEPSVTTRHVTEATQMDCEFGFVTFQELLDFVEKVGVSTLKYAEDKCTKELTHFGVAKLALGSPRGEAAGEAGKIPRLKLREAQEILFKETGRDSRNEKDLSPEDEVDICKWALTEHGSDFVTITHFPTKKRAFYTMPDPEDPEFSLSYDLLFRGLEILSGSQRINDHQQLLDTIKERGLDPENFSLYLQAFAYGMPPEGGFSFGLERLTMKLLELGNVRQACLFPRDMERIDTRLSKEQDSSKK